MLFSIWVNRAPLLGVYLHSVFCNIKIGFLYNVSESFQPRKHKHAQHKFVCDTCDLS